MSNEMNPVRIRDGHDNFFTPLRLAFAVLVMFGHAFAIVLRDANLEPSIFFNYSFSYLAVNLFFVASGFLVTKSMLYRGDKTSFISARVLRIFPALIVHVLFVMLIIGPLATNLPLADYFSHRDVWMQPLWVLSFFETSMFLPGIFATNGEQLGSAPLWTLRFEVICYFVTLIAFSIGFMTRKWMLLAQFVVPSIFWIFAQSYGLFEGLPASVENLFRFAIAYGLGATIFAYRDRISFTWAALPVLLGLCWLLQNNAAMEVAMNVLLAWFVMTVAYARVPKLVGLQKLDDLSYGIYIYHWAIMQLIFYWFPNVGIMQLFIIALPVVTLLAWLSWTFVEKPMLSKKAAFAAWLRFGRAPVDQSAKPVLLD